MLKVFLNEGIRRLPSLIQIQAQHGPRFVQCLTIEDYDRIRELTNLMKPPAILICALSSMAEMSLLPDMTIPSVSNQYSSSKLKGPILSPNLPKESIILQNLSALLLW